MQDESKVWLTIKFNDPNADAEELDKEVQSLLNQMRGMSEVELVKPVSDPSPPTEGKGGGFLLGMLTAEVNLTNIKTLFRFLADRLGNKAIELEVEANGKKLKVKASSREELEAAIQEAQKFISV